VARRILVMAHSEYDEEIRIISARPATPTERDFYQEDTTQAY